ncbi:MAG: hypothetical protein IKY44_04980, partial [Clostridia bacterium]|nr:hypothetical protein [Clostridia bacterium]
LKVEIQGYGEVSNVYNQVIKADKINHIAELIEVYYSKYDNLNGTGNPMFDYGGDKGENGTLPENGAMPDMAPSGYIISFKTATDYTVEYTLSGHILKNNTTNKTVFLSQSERTQLLFELTHTD